MEQPSLRISELKTEKWAYDTINVKSKDFFQDKFEHQIETPEFDKNVGRTTGFFYFS